MFVKDELPQIKAMRDAIHCRSRLVRRRLRSEVNYRRFGSRD